MNLEDLVRLSRKEPELEFLVIGAYAVAAHGYVRATFDVDFVVRRSQRDKWFDRALSAGMDCLGKSDVFAQFTVSDAEIDGFDLMFVDDKTYDTMVEHAVLRTFGEVEAPVPSLNHLLALKLHAVKSAPDLRASKDLNDIEILVRRNELPVEKPEYEELFRKHGSDEIYQLIRRLVRHG